MNVKRTRLGVIGSSGGSAIAAATECLVKAGKHVEWIVVTDRQCGLEDWARRSGHSVTRIDYDDTESFSKAAFAIFSAMDCHSILLFYTRRVASPLIDQLGVWNIHPSLLPAFPGLHGVRDAVTWGVKIFGATLHHVDSRIDSGKILAQICTPLSPSFTLEDAEYLSYLQKVWLTLIWFEQLHGSHGSIDIRNSYVPGLGISHPGLSDDRLRSSYKNFIKRSRQK